MHAFLQLASLHTFGFSSLDATTDGGNQGVEEWLGRLGMLQFQRLSPEHAEEAHYDGGASAVILTITLWGCRSLTLFGKENEEKVPGTEYSIENWLGQVYLCNLCPIRHQVRYPKSMTSRLGESGIANIPGLGSCGVSIIFRADIFGHAMASTGNALPGPHPVYKVFKDTFERTLLQNTLRMPSLEETLREGAGSGH